MAGLARGRERRVLSPEARQAGTDPRLPPRATAAAVVGAACILVFLWLALGRRPEAIVPGMPRAAPAASKETRKTDQVRAGERPEPPQRRWPLLAEGLALLEKNRHREAEAFFREQATSGRPDDPQTGMAIYFHAEALFAQGKYREAEPLYKRFVERFGTLPPADNARSALEYIAGADGYARALGRGSKS